MIPLFAVLFFSACFESVSDIQGISLWLCNMIWREQRARKRQKEREKGRERERGLSCWVSRPTVHSYFSARFTVVGCWLIVGLLSSFRHAWPGLISPVYCKPPLITLHTIKANILITACLIINSHWENERFSLTFVMWLTNKPENKTTCIFMSSKNMTKPKCLCRFLILKIEKFKIFGILTWSNCFWWIFLMSIIFCSLYIDSRQQWGWGAGLNVGCCSRGCCLLRKCACLPFSSRLLSLNLNLFAV